MSEYKLIYENFVRYYNSSKWFRLVTISTVASILCMIYLAYFLGGPDNLYKARDGNFLSFYAAVIQTTVKQYGQFPFWNPYYCSGGNVIIGHYEASWALNPFVLLPLLIFKLMPAIKISIYFHHVLGFVGAYYLSKRFARSNFAPLFGAMLFTFCGSFVHHFLEGHVHWFNFFYVPWVFYFYLRSIDVRRYVVLASLLLVLMIIGGHGGYSVTLTVISLSTLALFSFIQQKKWPYLINILLIGVLTLFIGFCFLVPIMEFAGSRPENFAEATDYMGLFELFKSFFARVPVDQAHVALEPARTMFSTWGFHENAHYIGFFPFLIFALGLITHFKRMWPLVASIILLMLFSMGNWSWISPYAISKWIPFIKSSHVPQRMLIIVVMFMGVLGSCFIAKFEKKNFYLTMLLLGGLTGGLMITNMPLYKNIFSVPSRKVRGGLISGLEKLNRKEFTIVNFKTGEEYSPLLPEFNKGATECDFTKELPEKRWDLGKSAVAYGTESYKGEEYLLLENGSVSSEFWSPNKLRLRIDVNSSDYLIINQNYAKGWRVNSPYQIEDRGGLLSVELPMGEHFVEFTYWPKNWTIYLIVSLLSLIFSAGVFIYFEIRHKKTS